MADISDQPSHRPDPSRALPGAPGNTRTPGIAESAGEKLPLVEGPKGPKGAVHRILDIYRDEMRKYIPGEFQSQGIDDWFVVGYMDLMRNPRLKERARKSYREAKILPSLLIDVGEFPNIIRNNPGVFKNVLQTSSVVDLMDEIRDARIKYEGHVQVTPHPLDVEQLGNNCAVVLRACGRTSAADAVERIAYASNESPEAAELEGGLPAQREQFDADPERRQQRPDERARLEATEAAEQLGGEQRAIVDVGDGPRSGGASQGGSSGSGGGPVALTLAGAGDDDHLPLIREDEQELRRPRRLPRRVRSAVVAVLVIVAIVAAVLIVIWPPEPPPPPAVVAPAIGGINCSPEQPTVGARVTCTAELSGDAPDSWSWTANGDPPTGTGEQFSTTASVPGDLTIDLTVGNAGGEDSKSYLVEVPPPPPPLPPEIERISCDPWPPTVGASVTCTAELKRSGGAPDSWSWTANGDPPTGTGEQFSTTASVPGDLTIDLTVKNAGGDDSELIVVAIPPLPPEIERISCDPWPPTVGASVTCTAELKRSGGAPDSWSWTANGDPPTGTGEQFSTTASVPGDLTIDLTVENAGGDDSELIVVAIPPLPPEIERISCDPWPPTVGASVTCTAELKRSGGAPDSWSWTANGDPPTGTGEQFSTTASVPGDLTIDLTVENAGGDDSELIVVAIPPLPPEIERISCDPWPPTVGASVTCTAELKRSGGAPDSWSWSIGGAPPTGGERRFTTVVRSAGDLTIDLTVENAGGDDSELIVVAIPPLPPEIERISCDPPSPTVGASVTCTAELSGGAPDSWSWSGGGVPPTGREPSFTTVVGWAGKWTIVLTVKNAGDKDSKSYLVEVPLPAECLELEEGELVPEKCLPPRGGDPLPAECLELEEGELVPEKCLPPRGGDPEP